MMPVQELRFAKVDGDPIATVKAAAHRFLLGNDRRSAFPQFTQREICCEFQAFQKRVM